jgi:hypothetical protein
VFEVVPCLGCEKGIRGLLVSDVEKVADEGNVLLLVWGCCSTAVDMLPGGGVNGSIPWAVDLHVPSGGMLQPTSRAGFGLSALVNRVQGHHGNNVFSQRLSVCIFCPRCCRDGCHNSTINILRRTTKKHLASQ